MRDRSLTEEQERGESVAEFSNGGHAREWRSGSGGYSRHNAAYSAVRFYKLTRNTVA